MNERQTSLGEIAMNVTVKVAGANKNPDASYIGLEHLETDNPRIQGSVPASQSISINTVFEPGDTLFGKLRPNLRKVAMAESAGYCSTDILAIRPLAGVESSFLSHTLRSQKVLQFATSTAFGTKMPRTSWAALKSVRVLAPEHSQQIRISNILDCLDRRILIADQIVAKIALARKGLLTDLIQRACHECAELRRLPLADVANVTVGYVGPTSPYYTAPDEGVLFLRTGNIGPGHVVLDNCRWVTKAFHASQPKSALHPGDVVVSRVGYTGTAAVVPDLGQANCANMIIIRSLGGVSPDWIRLLFESDVYRRQVIAFTAGSAQPVLNIGLVECLETPVPNLDWQDRVVGALSTIDRRARSERELGTKLRMLREGLAEDLLTGRVIMPEAVAL
jgi:type I restriction enzyme S subunit